MSLNPVEKRFAQENNLTDRQLRALQRLAQNAADVYTNEHNGDAKTGSGDKACNAFDVRAIQLGFTGVRWPGLYPQVRKPQVRKGKHGDDSQWLEFPMYEEK